MEKFMYYTVKIVVWGGLTIAILAIIPTTAILATWNTVPGEKLYPLKRNIEVTILKLFTGNFAMTADLQSQILDRRFNESQVLIAGSSGNDGLISLSSQIQAAKVEIVQASEKISPAPVVQTKAEKLVVQLKEYNQKLETTKTQISNNQPITSNRTPEPVVVKKVETIVKKDEIEEPKPEIKTESIKQIVQVEKAQQEIKVVVAELEKVVEKEKEKKKEENNKKDEEKKKEENDRQPEKNNKENKDNKDKENNKKD